MQYSEAGYAMTRSFEGLRLAAYRDDAGVLTIGYGHTGADVFEGQTITEAEAEELLTKDMAFAVSFVSSVVTVPLTQGQHDALCDFCFNVGSGNLRNSTLLRDVNAKDFAGAVEQFGRWVYVAGKVEPGLVARRKAEAEMFETGKVG